MLLASCAGFLSYWPSLGFIPLGAGSIWYAYDLFDLGGDDADTETGAASR